MLLRGLTWVFVAASFTSCASRSLAPALQTFPDQSIKPSSHIRGVITYGSALSSIAAVFERAFGFRPAPATIEFYPGDRAMQAALEAIGYDPAFAHDASSRLHAVAAHQRVFVNEARFAGESWASRTSTLAHELVHCVQFELAAGRRGSSEQWLREGFAEWMAVRVTEELGAVEPGATLETMRRSVRASRSPVQTLDEMKTFTQWAELAARPDTDVYAQATLAVDRLVARHGIEAVVRYFQQFADRDDAALNFREAFGEDRLAFEAGVAKEIGFKR